MYYDNRHYWNNKSQLSKKVKDHVLEMEGKYSTNIMHSIANSKIYMENYVFDEYPGMTDGNRIQTYLVNADSVNAAINAKVFGKIAIHNFASFKNPGGKFIDGSSAQEESLFHTSTLYNVLKEFKDYYKNNSYNTNYGLYYNRAIYSPDIIFNDMEMFDVITCAASNLSFQNKEWYKGKALDPEDVKRTIYERCKFVIDIAEENSINCLITGAFGCGVFKNDPYFIYKSFMDAINSRVFKNLKYVIFAIPRVGHSIVNYDVFYNSMMRK